MTCAITLNVCSSQFLTVLLLFLFVLFALIVFAVASDTSLHEFLNSFLKFRSRWYDLPHRGTRGIVAGVIFGEHDLSRRVFMVLYRM
jgi:hypothetical protein